MLANVTQTVQLVIRPVLGVGLISHAWPVLTTEQGYAAYVEVLRAVGMPGPELLAVLLSLLWFMGGIGVLLGAFTVLFSLLITLELTFRVLYLLYTGDGFPPPLPGLETSMLYLGELVSLVIAGGGRYAIDNLLWPPKQAIPAAAQ